MGRKLGIGVIGLGWMGRVHTTSYRRVLEHFPRLGVEARLVIAGDLTDARRAHAERVGFERTTADWRVVIEHPEVEAVSVTTPNAMHREVAIAAVEAGKHVWVEKPVGRGLDDTLAVAHAAKRAGVVSGVGFCYRFAPAVQHARRLIEGGAIGDVNHYRGVFLADYANRPDAAASWRFFRADAGSGALGDLMAHIVDMTHYLVGPIERLSGRTATMIPRRPAACRRRGNPLQSRADRRAGRRRERGLGRRDDRDGRRHAGLAGGEPRDRRPARTDAVRGPRHQGRARLGARADERARALPARRERPGRGLHARRRRRPDFAAFQPGAGVPMGYDDLRVLEARNFLASVRDGEQGAPGLDEMVATARVLDAIERSAESGAWERTR